MRRRVVPWAIACVALVSGAAHAFPAVSNEMPVDLPQIAQFGGGSAALSWTGSAYLAVWGEGRSRDTGSSPADLFTERVSASGALLDPVARPIVIADAKNPAVGGAGNGIDVASGGGGSLVVWTREVAYPDSDIAGAVLAADGSLAAGPFPIASAAHEQYAPAVAYGAGGYLVAWLDCRNASSGCVGGGLPELYAARVAADGTVLDPAGIPIAQPSSAIYQGPGVAFDGSRFAIAYAYGAPHLAYVAADGSVAADTTLDASGQHPLVAPFAGGALATWTDMGGAPGQTAAKVMPLDASGTSGAPTTLVTTAEGDSDMPAAAGSNGALVLWTDTRDVQGNFMHPHTYAARLDSNGKVLDPGGFLLSSFALPSDVASDGSGWLASVGGTAVRVDAAGNVLDDPPIQLSFAANREQAPAAAAGSDGTTLVAWEDSRDSTSTVRTTSVYAARLDASGAMLDPTAIQVAAPTASSPAVASDGSGYLVVANELDGANGGGSLVARRIAHDGSVLDASGIPLAAFGGYTYYCGPASAASDGSSYAVIWTCTGMDSFGADGAIVAADGTISATFSPPLPGWPASTSPPVIAFDGSGYLVAWGEEGNGTRAAHIAADGKTLDATPLVVATAAPVSRPAVACGAGTCLVVWDQCVSPLVNPCPASGVVGARVASGGVLDAQPIAISTIGERREKPSVAFDGSRFVVAWQDDRNGALDAYGNWVSLDGKVLAPGDAPLSALPADESSVALAAAPGGRVAVAYQRFDGGLAFANMRVRARVLAAAGALGASCQDDADCASGICSGGACCDTGCFDGGAGSGGASGAGGTWDAGGAPDAGGTPDAGDASGAGGASGESDSGGADAAAVDAGHPDAVQPDAAGSAPPAFRAEAGCACSAPRRSRGAGTMFGLVVLALAMAGARRRRDA